MNIESFFMVLGNIYKLLLEKETQRKADEFYRVVSVLLNKYNKTSNSLNVEDLESILDYDTYFNKFCYFEVKDTLQMVLEFTYGFNNFYALLNHFRSEQGFKYDNKYLMELFKRLNKKYASNLSNSRANGLFNLLKDNNLTYNNIGVRILIIKFLLSLNSLEELNIFQVENNRLNDDFKHFSVKFGEIKFFSKLYFIKEHNTIVIKTLLHDSISNVAFTVENNINFLYGGDNEDKTVKHIEDLKEFSRKYKDIELSRFNQLRFLYVKSYNLESQQIFSDDFIKYEDTEKLSIKNMLDYLNQKGSINRLSSLDLLDTLKMLNKFYLNYETEDNTLQNEITLEKDFILYPDEKELLY